LLETSGFFIQISTVMSQQASQNDETPYTGKRRFVAFFGPTVNDRKTLFHKATKICP